MLTTLGSWEFGVEVFAFSVSARLGSVSGVARLCARVDGALFELRGRYGLQPDLGQGFRMMRFASCSGEGMRAVTCC